MGKNQEGLIIEILSDCYKQKGITQENISSWSNKPPTFQDLRNEMEARIQSGFPDLILLVTSYKSS